LELLSVTVCGAEIVSTWTLPNGTTFGDTVGVTILPSPTTVIFCGVMSASSDTTTFETATPV
jgi:hypothetical protein